MGSQAPSANEPPRFMFVNKNAQDLTTRDSTLDRTKQRHVQLQHFAKKKQAAVRKGSKGGISLGATAVKDATPASGPPAWTTAGGLLTPVAEFPGLDRSTSMSSGEWPCNGTQEWRPPLQHDIIQGLGNSGLDTLSAVATPITSSQSSSSSPAQSGPALDDPSVESIDDDDPSLKLAVADGEFGGQKMLLRLKGASHDPFRSTVVVIDSWTHRIVEYYLWVVIPSLFAAEARGKRSKNLRHTPAAFEDIRLCMSDETHMHAFLAAISARMQRVEQKLLLPEDQRGPVKGPEYFKAKCLESLQSKLSADPNSIDQWLVHDVYRLFATELFAREYEAAMVHLQALRNMVDVLGGLQQLESYIMDRVILSDMFGAVQRLSPPAFPLTYDPGELPQAKKTRVRPATNSPLRNLGQRLTDESVSFLHPDMQGIFSDLVSLVQMVEYSWSHPDTPPSDAQWMMLRSAAIDHKLLSFPSTYTLPGDHNFSQECVRLAVIFWKGATIHDPIRLSSIQTLVPLLKQALLRSGMQCLWYPQSDILLWILVVGWMIDPTGTEAKWFATKAAKVALYLEIQSEAELARLLSTCFYLGRQNGPITELYNKFSDLLTESETVLMTYPARYYGP